MLGPTYKICTQIRLYPVTILTNFSFINNINAKYFVTLSPFLVYKSYEIGHISVGFLHFVSISATKLLHHVQPRLRKLNIFRLIVKFEWAVTFLSVIILGWNYNKTRIWRQKKHFRFGMFHLREKVVKIEILITSKRTFLCNEY